MPTCVRCGSEITPQVTFCPHCGTPNPEARTMNPADSGAPTALLEPDVLQQRLQAALGADFLVEAELGEGGFAHVFAVTDRKLSRRIAVKVLRPEFTGNRASVQRFVREAESAARLSHPNILAIYFVGEGQGLVYFGMPLVEGETLDALMRREGQLPETEVIRIGADIADALADAHAQHLVHRDVKPQNVMLQGPKRRVLVADFGIAKAASGSGEKLTGTGVIIGSPHYMSPEQASGLPDVDQRSDVYSLGVVLWEMLAGEVPFDGPSSQSILIQHLTKTMPAIGTKRPGVNHALAKVVARCTEKKPEHRYQGAAEVAEALRAAAAPAGGARRADRGRLVLGAVVAAAAVVVAAGGWLGWRALHQRAAAPPGVAGPGGDRLAVLPFLASGGGADTGLSRVAAELLAAEVEFTYQMPAVDPRDLLGRWVEEKLTPLQPLADLAAFASRLGGGRMAVGSLMKAGRDMRLSIAVYETKAQTRLLSGEVTGDTAELFSLVEGLAKQVAVTRCSEPDFNPGNICFDTPPRLSTPVLVTVPDSLARADSLVRQASLPSYWVRVSKAGGVSDARVRRASSSDTVTALGLEAVNAADYAPATKDRKPVEAWMPVSVTLKRR
jgi:serine/threonine-protein kinase